MFVDNGVKDVGWLVGVGRERTIAIRPVTYTLSLKLQSPIPLLKPPCREEGAVSVADAAGLAPVACRPWV